MLKIFVKKIMYIIVIWFIAHEKGIMYELVDR